jgi:heat shock protein HspQ
MSGTDSTTKDTRCARWSIGQLVHHRLFDYRGAICDVDAQFMLSDEWYEQVARSRPPKDEPWYRVLVDGTTQETYVAQRNLEADNSLRPIEHPLTDYYFKGFVDGRYLLGRQN